MRKKLAERAMVEAFLASDVSAPATLEEWNRERPDALIEVGQRLVGVEVTILRESESRHATAPQQWKAEAKRVVDTARVAFDATNSMSVVVRFEFTPNWTPPSKKGAAQLARELASIVVDCASRLMPDSSRPPTCPRR